LNRQLLKNGHVAPVSREERSKWAQEENRRYPGSNITPETVALFYRTKHWAQAGRAPTEPGITFYDDYWPQGGGIDALGEWLNNRFVETCVRREYFEEDPCPASVPHYSVHKGMPRAFIYAVGLGNGIKVGKSGTGEGDLLMQLRGRFGAYKSTHKVEVIGIADHPLQRVDKAEALLLELLSEHKLDQGLEMFEDCGLVRQILWEQFQLYWHQDKELPTRVQRMAYWNATRHSPFHGLQGKSHHFALGWPDYVRLVEEIDLLTHVNSDLEIFVDLFNAFRKEKGLPEFGDQDDEFAEALSLYLPKSESLYPNARKRLESLFDLVK